ncbi:thiamine pyrophosphate-dependent dehydrogenase E1 component subunit alpha [Anaerovorax odorimutans]|uniref:Thiamine pyrophosphate-dependent dehydrogenase E1 component subunit alpha n=2 Tax=Anaerovorax odorimutans TaxID=109327 RepID=A0ABT1RM48_9FIRM|nr:thiamine pyrophosphate-dependent dehydrogenase E1 component subunit alpha [Anaerovorax odorimutans]MCQ4636261.1 thiamine pyrophosphate-dependent dehydrogenase E1 component subunit alpha [Anaerovorax odorimutans]
MLKIRLFEARVSKCFAKGQVQGFVHLCIGQEATAAGVCANLNQGDYISSTHRGHGHIISKGADIKTMMAELFGKESGYCHGKGGSMHISDTSIGILGANGIVGGGFNLAAGAALACQMKKSGNIVVCFFGDGSSNEGSWHEAMNISSVWKLPILFVCENNLYGISSRVDRSMAVKNVADRAVAYGMKSTVAYGNDVTVVYETAKEAVEYVRSGNGPMLVEYKTYRQHGHFEGEPDVYRSPEEIREWLDQDPIKNCEALIKEKDILTGEERSMLQEKIESEINEAVRFAEESQFPPAALAVKDVYTDIVEEGRVDR